METFKKRNSFPTGKIVMRAIGSIILVFAICLIVYASSDGPSDGATVSTSPYGTNNSWSNPTNVTNSDDAYAVASVDDGESSDYLTVTNFGFAISSGVVIDGIEVTVEKKGQSSKIKDASVMLIVGGVITGDDKATTPSWSGSDFHDTYGSSSDMWGLSLTDADINSSNFGIAFALAKSSNGGGAKQGSVDNIQITIHYSSPLPIKLTSFKANTVDNKKIKLEWATASEKNNDYFSLERSENGASFEKITTTKGAGNSTTPISYSTYDNNPIFGNAYYRLRQTDYDGKFTYSDLISVAVHATSSSSKCKFNVRPNPCPGQCNIYVTECDDKNISVALIDALGHEVNSKIPVNEEEKSFSIDATNNLAPGVYIVMGSSKEQGVFSQKVVVQ